MLSPKIKKITKLLIIFSSVSVLVFGFACAGMFHKTAMPIILTDSTSMITQNAQPCCGSSISHHFDSWRNAFIAVPEKVRDSLMLLILGLVLALGFSWFPFQYHKPDKLTLPSRLYLKQNPDFTLFNHLKLAFIRGVLNPKIY